MEGNLGKPKFPQIVLARDQGVVLSMVGDGAGEKHALRFENDDDDVWHSI